MKARTMFIFLFIPFLFVAGGLAAFAAEEPTGLLREQEAALRAIAKGELGKWTPMTRVQATALAGKADTQWQELDRYLLPFGQVADVYWRD
jgi:hypothetical protein